MTCPTDAVTIDTSNLNRDVTFGSTIDSEVTGANEEQILTLPDATGGQFRIEWDPPPLAGGEAVGHVRTDLIDFNASATDVRDAFVAAINAAFVAADPSFATDPAFTTNPMLVVKSANINVIREVVGDPGGPFTYSYAITFRGAFRGTDVKPVTIDDSLIAGGPTTVLTTLPGKEIIAEHNPLTLIAGTGMIQFGGDIGAGFVDVGLGVDGDQTPGNLTVTSADKVTFANVALVAVNGTIDLGAGANVITSGIDISGFQVFANEGVLVSECSQFLEERYELVIGEAGTGIDGLRVDWADGFGLIRASNTTPVLVLRFEGQTQEALLRIEAQMLAGKP